MVDCIQEPDGRWRWIEILPGNDGFTLNRGYVTFATEAEAATDLGVQLQAGIDDTGRIRVPFEHLEKLIRAYSEVCPGCHGTAYPGRLTAQPRDVEGCNWDLVGAAAPKHVACADASHPDPRELRQVFALVEP